MNPRDGIYRIEQIGEGWLAISPQPAAEGDPRTRVEQIAAAGFHQVVSLLETAEADALGLGHEMELVESMKMAFVSFPIADFSEPGSVSEFAGLSQRLFCYLQAGRSTLVHCRGGIGRSGLLAVAVLLQGGMNVHEAIARVTERRGSASPETTAQRQWLADNAAGITARASASREVTG